MMWEHEGNRACRLGDWKLVSEGNTRWELYNMKSDRTEPDDLSGAKPEVLARMVRMYEGWAERVGALPWPVINGVTASPRPGTSPHSRGPLEPALASMPAPTQLDGAETSRSRLVRF